MSLNNPINDSEWVEIPAGEFVMGSPESEPEHEDDEVEHSVELKAFSMMQYTVTFAQYDAYCALQGLERKKDDGWGRGQRPVLFVAWLEAKAFAKWLTDITGCVHRLPTEAEWEYACRAGTDGPFSFECEVGTGDANYDGREAYNEGETGQLRGKTLEVGQFAPNPWGLYDMHGNVWEWTASLYDRDYEGQEQESANEHVFGPRVVRGGSWFHFVNNIRSAYRGRGYPETSIHSFGFRLVREVKAN